MSYLLRLRQYINEPSSLNLQNEWIALDNSDQPAILVYGESLSLALLKSDKLAPTNFIEYYKKLLRLPDRSLPTIDNIFKWSPVLLHGEDHLQSRKIFSKKYRLIEEELQIWLPDYTTNFFSSISTDDVINPIQLVANYISGFFREILAQDLNISQTEIPPLPPKLFFLTHPLVKVVDVESKLNALKEFLEKTLLRQKRDPSEIWTLLAVIVAGFEALEGTLIYGVTKDPDIGAAWDAKTLIRDAAAVNFIGRRALENFSIGDFTIAKNQELYVCPSLVHKHMGTNNLESNERSFSFGKGVHTCIGQTISISVINSFIAEWHLFLRHHPKIAPVKYLRDFNLTFTLR
ncbi:hypothetical protein A9236_01360 [Polynucleobacter sp. QLW-P1DATA-2]|jgi:hypothetical protein|uniref:hypothetical protein n=1 Tax=Polynucleobacter sp. QLW-P1DATA-2 TaxID=1743167 RepID=UPI0008F87BB5|nr:hypothetical protein [Polynucleobacter sp. QLW-P1DATA-2]OIN03581.1 hypothetical protein A9236_01360 [Polynucleobacter sp. QLW-P1DATA-2]